MSNTSEPLTYRAAGVNVAAADAFVKSIGALAKSTHNASVVPDRGEYAGLFRPDIKGMQDPLIAATCDGVGTKLLVARAMELYSGLGQDLVAMNVNDLLPSGARPLFFLDYIACGSLRPAAMHALMEGITGACKVAGCALLGGETAEMPGVYAPHDFDLAGFAVGLVDGKRIPDPQSVAVGDVVLGLAASGVHSNGLSLARQALIERGGLHYHDTPPELEASVGATLLTPTPIYVQQVLQLLDVVAVKAAAHVTGGGISGRGGRLLQPEQRMLLQKDAFAVPKIFELIAERGQVAAQEMASTFNMGLGYLTIVDAELAQQHQQHWQSIGFVQVGSIAAGDIGVEFV